MYGGTILGNMSSRHGGGVNVSMSSDGSEFNMYGGSVCYNSAAWGGGINIFASARVSGESLIENNVASNGGGTLVPRSRGTHTITPTLFFLIKQNFIRNMEHFTTSRVILEQGSCLSSLCRTDPITPMLLRKLLEGTERNHGN